MEPNGEWIEMPKKITSTWGLCRKRERGGEIATGTERISTRERG